MASDNLPSWANLAKHLSTFTVTLNKVIENDHRYPAANRAKCFGEYFSYDEFQSLHNAFPMVSSTRRVLEVLQDKLLKHKWGDVVVILVGMMQLNWKGNVFKEQDASKTYEEIVWRVGMDAILHHPIRRSDTVEKHISSHRRALKNYFDTIDQIQILLEHSFFRLSQRQFESAKEELQDYQTVEKSNKEKEQRMQHIETWTLMIEGYLGLLEYVLWQSMHARSDQFEFDDEENLSRIQTTANAAIKHFEVLNGKPGVWDIFVTKHVEILTYHGDVDIARNVLVSYSETNLENPNAHKYLCQFLSRYYLNDNSAVITSTRMSALCRLFKIAPTDNASLDLFRIYLEHLKREENLDTSGSHSSNLYNAFNVLFTMLDYPLCSREPAVWNKLNDLLSYLLSKLDRKKVRKLIRKYMKETERLTWWPSFHSLHSAEGHDLNQAKLFLVKVLKKSDAGP